MVYFLSSFFSALEGDWRGFLFLLAKGALGKKQGGWESSGQGGIFFKAWRFALFACPYGRMKFIQASLSFFWFYYADTFYGFITWHVHLFQVHSAPIISPYFLFFLVFLFLVFGFFFFFLALDADGII